MTKKRLGISSFWLKLAAIACMTCNHVANVFAASLPSPALLALYSLGGLTYPIMAFLLVVGYSHTSSVTRYALRLAVFAVLSQIPYTLLWGPVPNVLFTLLVGLGILWLEDRLSSRPAFAVALIVAVVGTVSFDWGAIGVILVFLFRMVRSKRQTVALALVIPVLALGLPPLLELPGLLAGGPASAAGTAGGLAADVASGLVPFSLDDLISGSMAFTNQNTIYQAGSLLAAEGSVGYALLGIPAAGGLLSCYNGRRGRSLKWLFYAYYPAHLAVIWAIATYLV